MVELLKQGQYVPMPVEEQIISIFAGVRGYLDGLALDKITSFETKLRAELKASGQELLETIRTEKEITKTTEDKLKAFLDKFLKTFV